MSPDLRAQWRDLSVHDRYAIAMFGVLYVIPGLALLGFLVALAWEVLT